MTASVEEVSAQVEEVTASAQSLSAMVQELQALMAQFGLWNLASTGQAEKAAQDLNELARTLTETVEQYKL